MSMFDKLVNFTNNAFGIKAPPMGSKIDAVTGASPMSAPKIISSNKTASSAVYENSLTETKNLDNKTYDAAELESRKTELTTKKAAAEGELSSINSGESKELSALKGSMDKAYEEYQNAMSKDTKSNPELASLKQQQDDVKTKSDENSQNITIKESDISANETKIAEQESVISGFEGELSTLNSQLSSIPKNSDEKGSEKNNAKLDKQRADLKNLIALKKQEISLAKEKLSRLEQEKESLNLELTGLKEEKTNLENQNKEVQEQIQETSSKATQNAQEKYNQAKEAFESARSEKSSAKQEEISDIQAQINEVEAQLTEARNQEYEKGKYNITGQDVIQLANQYEGLTNNEMREIFQNEGAQFDDGAWCADFVTHMMNKAYGKDNTPGNFYNECPMFCAVREVKSWGENNGRTTNDIKDVKAGDAIIINTASGGLHIGFVSSFNEDGTINTIEGNTLDDKGFYDDNNPGQVNKRLRRPEEVNTYVKFHGKNC